MIIRVPVTGRRLFSAQVYLISIYAAVLLLLSACTTSTTTPASGLEEYEDVNPALAMSAPPPAEEKYTEDRKTLIDHGRYMVELMGCSSCHTDGALIGEPDHKRQLAGSRVGIAYSDPIANRNPGVVFPGNLTPDPETGLGQWNEDKIVRMLRFGVDRHGIQKLSVMPWPTYSKLQDEDARAIAAYLMSLEPVANKVPENVVPGQKTEETFVHFGLYRNKR